MSSRERFEAWYAVNAFNYERDPIGSRDCGLQWAAWQAAERETARKCAEIARGVMHANNSSDDHYGDMVDGKYMAAKEVAHTIKAEFPEAWK